MINIFSPEGASTMIDRINSLSDSSKPLWGKMSVAHMLAHCNVTYELVYESEKHPKPNFMMGIILKLFVKNTVVNDVAYKRNERTAPFFIINDDRDFNKEKGRLIEYISKTQSLGGENFDGKESHSFGKLSTQEWNNMFSKHLDHHLRQFGV